MAQRADLSGAAFGKITAVYGQIAENGPSVRKWLARKKSITDKCSKKRLLSVNPQHNGQKFTDKPAKMDTLSVNLSELVEQHCI